METEKNYLNQLTEKVKENLPSSVEVQNILKENEHFFKAAGGAFLTVVGLKFISKTVGFLALVGGATLLYRSAMSIQPVKQVLDNLAAPQTPEKQSVQSKVLADATL